ncbi:ketoacyl-ACP synthase III family protein [Streptosporangiaceae bacterium NEAU-GS5]|nr:ketoacyl-ACP synthase III family protein [Streptosporangiaceae bacterium NEAU-GS5]
MKVDGIRIAGLGVYLPEPVSVERAVEEGLYDPVECEQSGWTGAAVAGDISAPDMAVLAARQAMASSGHQAAEVDVVMHASGYHQGPLMWSAHHYVQRHSIGGHAPALGVLQTCNGMLGALELACGYLALGDRTAALITGADNFGTPLLNRWSYASGARTNRGSILGDAAAAMVVSRRSGFAELLAIGSMSLPDQEEMYRGDTPLFPPDATVGRPVALGARVAEFAARHPREFAAAKEDLVKARVTLGERTLAEAGVEPGQITRATHVFSGGAEYIRSVLEPLGIDPARGVLDLGRSVGHLGVADHFVAFDHLVKTGRLGPGDHVMMISNGGGTTLSCAVLRMLEV